MDVLHVWVQQRVFFGRMSPGYEQYKREMPMLISTPANIARCWQSLRGSSEDKGTIRKTARKKGLAFC
jgi:hypothetical protein